ncbi:MAG: hypothetical protein MZV49_08940 [Rhodopseudomonas palustris]|nr:hypothetical protein [Rhodopseudomonas palustris]
MSCALDPAGDGTGTVSLGIRDGMTGAPRTIWPDGNPSFFVPATWRVSWTDGVTSADSGVMVAPVSANYSVTGLEPDPWSFTVDAWNSGGLLCGHGMVVSIPVTSGGTATPTVTVGIVSGTGSFDFDLAWPLSAVGTSARVSARLEPLPSGTSIILATVADIPMEDATTGITGAPCPGRRFRWQLPLRPGAGQLRQPARLGPGRHCFRRGRPPERLRALPGRRGSEPASRTR